MGNINYDIDENKRSLTDCPHGETCKVLKSIRVGSTYCLHNGCGYNKGFDTAQKIVNCGYGE